MKLIKNKRVQRVNKVVTHSINRPPNLTRQTLAETLYVPHFIVHKGLLATVCLHFVAFCCFFVSKRETNRDEKETSDFDYCRCRNI